MKRGAGIFFTNGQKVLILRRSGKVRKDRYANQWCLPGGKVEAGETDIEAAKRECREECGSCPGERAGMLSHTHGNFKWTSFFFKVGNTFSCKLSDEHTDWKWVDLDDLPKQTLIRPFRQHIERYIEKAQKIG